MGKTMANCRANVFCNKAGTEYQCSGPSGIHCCDGDANGDDGGVLFVC